jgi:hypothetical protein
MCRWHGKSSRKEKGHLISDPTEFDELLRVSPATKARRHAIRRVQEDRRAEIALYWTRSNYFWTITGVALTGYFVAESSRKPLGHDLLLGLACMGMVFSVAWYCVNRGSYMYQINCDRQLMLLENKVAFPATRLRLAPEKYSWWCLWRPYGYSVVRVSVILSGATVVAWALLVFRNTSLIIYPKFQPFGVCLNAIVILVATSVFVCQLLKDSPVVDDRASFKLAKLPLDADEGESVQKSS